MSRIALVWELGSSYGHISLLLPFAKRLQQRGHDVILVLRELHHAGNLVNDGIPLLQAPLWLPPSPGLSEPPLNYSEILLRYGYLNPDGLAGLVSAWRTIFELHASDMIVADHSPTALLAARSMGLAAATLGTGFNFPPRQTPMHNMRPWLNVPRERLEHSDATVLNTMNIVLAPYQKGPLATVADLFQTEENFLCTFAELDHYPLREPGKYWGACYNLEMGQEITWPNGAGQKVFVYLDPQGRDFVKVLEAISRLGHRAIVCAPGIPDNLRRQHESSRIVISSKPFQLKALLMDCDLAIGNAGHALTTGMLLAGVPMLLLPTHLERFLMATRIAALGAGIAVNPETPPPDYMAVIHALLNTPSYRENARKFSIKYADFNQEEQQEKIVARIEEIAAAQQVTA
ncbi:MAG: nucleotide disphospho-sugar-binding domain-containing protein [Nitrosomonadales bacterium]